MKSRFLTPTRLTLRLAPRLGLLLALVLLLQGCSFNFFDSVGARSELHPETLVPAKGFFTSDRILWIDLKGIVDIEGGGGGFFGSPRPGMLVSLKDRLKAAEKDHRVRAVILYINSPGGGVTASDLIHHEILEFKEETQIPVIAYMGGVAASGGIYIAMAADEIYATPTTVTGSIGVISIFPGLEGLGEKIGLEMRVIKSGANKDLGSPWTSLSDEQRAIFQELIDGMYDGFVKVVMDSRGDKGFERASLKTVADGRVYSSAKAVEANLIDGIFYPEELIEYVRELIGSPGAAIVSYEYQGSRRLGNIYAYAPVSSPRAGFPAEINLLKFDLGLGALPSETRFYYLWLP